MSNNNVKDWGEFNKLAELPQLEDLVFVGQCANESTSVSTTVLSLIGNPLEEKHSADGDWRDKACDKLKKLKKLDGELVHNSIIIHDSISKKTVIIAQGFQ